MITTEWEERLAEAWARLDDLPEPEFLMLIEKLVEELAPDHPVALFERACALDSTGHSDLAVPLYERALERGLPGIRRRRAAIQLASSLRNVGDVPRSIAILEQEREAPSDELDDALAAVYALSLTAGGREREAVAVALTALAPHLPRYQRSTANYARLLR
ncbi:tetratricopeptide repeat protein [Actinoplanes sp. NPDC051494]|uniref:tetratricopeptide repeat protein n=1 Tax=Actinoplanes sp. NPDC051494 TaxID=3363907 RepID=UPI0037A93F85